MACGLSCPTACGLLVLSPGTELVFPALESRFLTTGPAGKCQAVYFFDIELYELFICIISHIICKYFLPFSRNIFILLMVLLCKIFKFNLDLFVYFCFCFLCLKRQILKNIAVIYMNECSAYIIF